MRYDIRFATALVLTTLFTWGHPRSYNVAARETAAPEEIPLWSGDAPRSHHETVVETRAERGDAQAPFGWVTGVSRPTLFVYLPAAEKRSGTGIVICPGGGYAGLAIDHEGHALAQWFADRGVAAAVLKYRCAPFKHPVPLGDAQRALRLMRSRAEPWHLQTDRIGLAGFSAGGHLASTAGTHSDDGDPDAEDPIDRASCRADFMVLGYPVISMEEGVGHRGSQKNLLGDSPSPEMIRELSNHLHVTAETGPTFLVHAADDNAVPAENSLLFYSALRKHKVPAELHIFEQGGHGFGMFRGDRPADYWPELLEGWLRGHGLIQRIPAH